MNRPEYRGTPAGLGDLPRWSLYLSALVLLGALAIPMVVANRRIGRREKALICALGVSQTLAALALAAAFAFWVAGAIRELANP